MKNYLVLIFILTAAFLTRSRLSAQAPVPVKRIIFEQKEASFYMEQYQAWKKVIENRKQDASAWMNYYTAAHYARIFNQEEADNIGLDEIIAGVKSALPNSFEALYLAYWRADYPGKKESDSLLKIAYDKDPSRSETYDAFIRKAAISGDQALMKEFSQKHFESNMHSPGFLNWNYNVLVNLEEDAILFTHGDNDTYPAWKIQAVNNVRTDVDVINTSLLGLPEYQNQIAKKLGIPAFNLDVNVVRDYAKFEALLVKHVIENTKRPIYIGIGSSESLKAAFQDSTYLIGLSLKYSTEPVDNMPIIVNSYDHLFHLDYLEQNYAADPSQAALDKFSQSYLPSMLKAYAHNKKTGNKAGEEKMKRLILIIGEKTGNLEKVKSYLN